MQTPISEDIFASVNIQRRINTSNGFNSRYFFSIGLSGMLNKNRSNKKNIPDPVVSVPPTNVSEISDKDHDGVPDSEDNCPELPGTLLEKGCPTDQSGKAAIEKMLDSLAKNIFFESNSSSLKPESYQPLDEVVGLMKKYSTIIVQINGHADSIGADKNNLSLSIARAKEVLTYVNKKEYCYTDYKRKDMENPYLLPITQHMRVES